MSESQTVEELDLDDLISISPCGRTHLEMLYNLDYLAAISEDVWFREQPIAEDIAKKIADKWHYSWDVAYSNALTLINYLTEYHKEYFPPVANYLNDTPISVTEELSNIKSWLEKQKKEQFGPLEKEALKCAYPIGLTVDTQVLVVGRHGLLVEFGVNAIGFIDAKEFEGLPEDVDIKIGGIDVGDTLKAQIIDYKRFTKRFKLKLVY
jgi:hypothetical protein